MEFLDVQGLQTYFYTTKGTVRAVDDVSFNVKRGEASGIAGESGCGKSTTALSIMKLIKPPGRIVGGQILFEGDDLVMKEKKMMEDIRWKQIAMVFQGAMNALNPVYTVGQQIVEGIVRHERISDDDAWERVSKLLNLVGVDPSRAKEYPHEFSGGMKQRVMIAMALACNPRLVIADEPTTALDVIVQKQVLKLMRDLQKQLNLSIILISHDLSIIAQVCDRVLIMYAGKIVENADVFSLFTNPFHPYTQGLIKAFPNIKRRDGRLTSIPGAPPSLIHPPSGCRFHPRCPFAKDKCRTQEPQLAEMEHNHFVACHYRM